MPSSSHVWAFLAASVVILAIPGPSVLFIIGRALAAGRRDALLTVVGNAMGVFVQIALVAAGLGAIVARSAVVYSAVKVAGAAYLIWLGISAIRHRREGMTGVADLAERPPTSPRRSTWLSLRTGMVVGLTNPKSIVFFVALLPQFVSPVDGPVWVQMVVLGVFFLVMALLFDGAWALAASHLRGTFTRRPERVAGVRASGGVLMIGVGAVLMASERPA